MKPRKGLVCEAVTYVPVLCGESARVRVESVLEDVEYIAMCKKHADETKERWPETKFLEVSDEPLPVRYLGR